MSSSRLVTAVPPRGSTADNLSARGNAIAQRKTDIPLRLAPMMNMLLHSPDSTDKTDNFAEKELNCYDDNPNWSPKGNDILAILLLTQLKKNCNQTILPPLNEQLHTEIPEKNIQ